MPLVRRTRATLRRAEFGFFGVFVYTRVHTPRRWGEPLSAAGLGLFDLDSRPLRTSCWIVGTDDLRDRNGRGTAGRGRGRNAHQGGGERHWGKGPAATRSGPEPQR